MNITRDALGACTDLAHARASDGPGKVSFDLFAYMYMYMYICMYTLCMFLYIYSDYVSGLQVLYASLN